MRERAKEEGEKTLFPGNPASGGEMEKERKKELREL